MGLVNTNVILKNPRISELKAVEVDALVDTGAVYLCIPVHVRIQLELEEIDKKDVTLVDGSEKLVPKWGMMEHIALLKEQGLPIPPKNSKLKITIQNEEHESGHKSVNTGFEALTH